MHLTDYPDKIRGFLSIMAGMELVNLLHF